jgi:hypothetical protein
MKLRAEEIARMCHETIRAYTRALGDTSYLHWEDTPQWQKDTTINGVLFHLRNPDAGPADSHENWMKQKFTEGWKHGPVKDPEKKEHPLLVAYEDLPLQQRMKDHLIVAIVKTASQI